MSPGNFFHPVRLRERRAKEAGSAYVITLLVLLILTLTGLALTVITTTEMQVGANEQVIQQAFFAADAGIGVNLARAFHRNETNYMTLVLPDPPGGGTNPLLGNEFFLRHTFLLSDMPCNLCEVVESDKKYIRLNLLSTSTGRRVNKSDGKVVAERTVSAVYDMMVIEQGNLDPYYSLEESQMGVTDKDSLPGLL